MTKNFTGIEIRDLCNSFNTKAGRLEVIKGLNLHVKESEFVSIIGPSGCGKSTLFNIMAGLEAATTGEVLVNDRQSKAVEDFAYMPQKDMLFPWRRVLGNALLGLEIQGVPRKEAMIRADPLFEAFGLSGFETFYPHEVSGGMRQRIALLRTVIQGRNVVLLDEPFGALDSMTRTQMQQWMETVWNKYRWTVLLVTHDIREAIYLSDRIFIFSDRPADVRSIIEVSIPRPRSLDFFRSDEFLALERRLSFELRKDLVLMDH